MTKTRGEGRSGSEKAQTVITPYAVRKQKREQLKKEEAEWSERSGPVVSRRRDEEKDAGED